MRNSTPENSTPEDVDTPFARLAYYQFAPAYMAVGENLDHLERVVQRQDADLLVLPELCTSGYLFRDAGELARIAESVPDGETTRRMVGIASENGVSIVAGLAERGSDGRLFNSAILVSPRGFLGVYRKVHLFDREKELFEPGDSGFPVFDIPVGAGHTARVGIMICFDWQFPEAARTLALRGAEVIAHPSNLILDKCPRTMPVRAQENGVFTVTANRTGSERAGEVLVTFTGSSLICDPAGQVRIGAPDRGEEWGAVTVDLGEAHSKMVTPSNHLLYDRRPDLYDR
jgi:predicted amidohydrolase